MTDKERLEEIKMDNERHHQEVVFSSKVLKDINWLIQQVERLEKENKRCRYNESYVRLLEIENKRLCEALEFYADENNYREHDLKGIVPSRSIAYKPILHDYGSIARKALEGEE